MDNGISSRTDGEERCTSCNVTCVSADGQLVCPSCGLVIEHELLNVPSFLHQDYRRYPSFREARRIQFLDLGSRSRSHAQVLNVLSLSRMLRSRLELPCIVFDMAQTKYIKAKGFKMFKRISNVSLFAASVLTSARSSGCAVSPSELRLALESIGCKVSQREMLKALTHLRYLGLYTPSTNLDAHISALVGRLLDEGILGCSTLDGPSKSQLISERAKWLVTIISNVELAGRNPRVVASAAVYAAARMLSRGKRACLTQRRTAELNGVAEYSVRECYGKVFSEPISSRSVSRVMISSSDSRNEADLLRSVNVKKISTLTQSSSE